ncbi:hypothetical protein [Bacillus litorisediminis]|uniref:hypothetical protein n=1 Tax=Bacillus litorisediminis TaxID=2922713 RepID=UPI001FAE34ED|nr:hypothetical protein [Bacillus litorisediminis]
MKTKRFKFIVLAVVALMLAFSMTSFANDENKEDITLDDVQLEPGKVDLEKLPKELKEKVKNKVEKVDAYFIELHDTQAKLDYLEELSKDN